MMKWPPPPTPLYIGVYNESNPYNYWLNLNHPDVQAAYKAYCTGIGHPPRYPLSDWQRWDFEIGFVQRRGVGPDMPEWIRYQYCLLFKLSLFLLKKRGQGAGHRYVTGA